MFLLFDIILILIAFVVQGAMARHISIADTVPDITLLISVYAGLHGGKNRGTTVGAIAGFMQDNISVGILGINTFSKGLIGYILGSIRNKILSENTITQSLFIFLSSLFDSFFFLFIAQVLLQFKITKESYVTDALYQITYNTVFGHILFLFLSKIEKKFY